MTYGISQIIMMIILSASLISSFIHHGELEIRRYNFWRCFIATAIEYVILKTGGFF